MSEQTTSLSPVVAQSQKSLDIFSFLYAFFLVFVTPLSVPWLIWAVANNHISENVILITLVMYCLSGLGITLGYHRLITHRAFQTKPWIKALLLLFGSFAMQGGVASWASLHIQHHRFSDKPGDPHSPKQSGFWYAHCGWIFYDYKPNFQRFGKWLLKDKMVVHFTRYYLVYSSLGLVIPALLAGWEGLLCAGFFRLFVTCHVTWAINSMCHQFGSRDFSTKDTSTNHFMIALLSFGEGWHNNHHRFMQSPFFGMKWYQIDFGKWVLMALQRCKLVWDLKLPQELRS